VGLEDWLIRVGPPAVLIGSAVEGDLVPLLAGVIAHLGYLDPVTAVVLCTVGLLLGDSAWYAAGRRMGARIKTTRAWRRVGPRVERLVARFGPVELVLSRVVYGTRNLSMLFWGTQHLRLATFYALDVPACLAWSALLVGLGHGASGGASALMGEVAAVEKALLVAVVLAVAAGAVWRWASRRACDEP
jgi:membrane protein DedA with SNARE-associated domain